MALKGTCRLMAVLKVCNYPSFGASLSVRERRAPYFYVRYSGMNEIWIYGIIGSVVAAAIGVAYNATLKAAGMAHSLKLANEEAARLRKQLDSIQDEPNKLSPETSNANPMFEAGEAKNLGYELCHCKQPFKRRQSMSLVYSLNKRSKAGSFLVVCLRAIHCPLLKSFPSKGLTTTKISISRA